MHAPREDSLPWFKQFWPWFLISIPAGTVIAGILTLNLAVESNDGLVKDDYYKEGLAIHKDADRVLAAERLGLHGKLTHDPVSGRVELLLQGTPSSLLKLTLYHPTRSHQDQVVDLQNAGNGRYVGLLKSLTPANWRVSVEPQDGEWRISGRLPVALDQHGHPTAALN